VIAAPCNPPAILHSHMSETDALQPLQKTCLDVLPDAPEAGGIRRMKPNLDPTDFLHCRFWSTVCFSTAFTFKSHIRKVHHATF
jgi:hypothetical protein